MASSDTSTSTPAPSHPPTGNTPMLARQRAAEHGAPAPKGGYFPLGYKEGFSQWWASLSPEVTEHRVMSFIPHLQQRAPTNQDDKENAIQRTTTRDPHGNRQWQSQMVQLKGKNRYLNEFSVERLGEEVDNNLVMLHGYGAGLGFFYKNYEALSRLPNWKLYALDMLGMGRSSRPNFKIQAKDKEAKVREAESWFIDALEEWRIKRGIDKFTLLGHSLGGYMAVCYALKYPGHLNKLILASPVGIPEDPYAVNEALPEPQSSTLESEFTDSSQQETSKTALKPRKPLPGWLTTLWDANISPFSLVRWSGPVGPRLVSGWTSRRFSHLPPEESQALHDYSYSLFRQRGSGEYALAYVLAPGAFARSPLIRRIQGVGRQYLNPATSDGDLTKTVVAKAKETGIPVVLMYGENDWMDVAGGYASEEKIKQAKKAALAEASEEEKRKENGDVKVTVIQKAGHHLYLEGYEQFNNEILGEMRDVERRRARLDGV